MVESYLTLAEALGCPPEPPRLELAVTEAEDRLGDQIWGNLGLRTDGRVVAVNERRRLRLGQALAGGALRRIGPSDRGRFGSRRVGGLRTGRGRRGAPNRRPCRLPARVLAGRSAVGAGGHEGLLAAQPADRIHRQWPAARGGRLRQTGRNAAGSDVAHLDRQSDRARRNGPAGTGLSRLRQASLPIGPSPLHAGVVARLGVGCGGAHPAERRATNGAGQFGRRQGWRQNRKLRVRNCVAVQRMPLLFRGCGGKRGARDLPERPGGCCAQMVPVPFFPATVRAPLGRRVSLGPAGLRQGMAPCPAPVVIGKSQRRLTSAAEHPTIA